MSKFPEFSQCLNKGCTDRVIDAVPRLAIVAFITLLTSACSEPAPAPLPLEIPYIIVETEDVSIPLEVVGETMGSIDVSIRSRVDGFLDGIHFEEGSFVAKGALLYTIDPQPFEAKMAQAQASFAQAQTGLAKTKADLDRIRPLAEMKAVSEQDLDSAVANYDAAQSFVDAATAQVELAGLELSYTRIHAPVQGLIGLTKAQVGDYITQQNNGGLLNTVSRIDPISVRISIAERGYLTAVRQLAAEDAVQNSVQGLRQERNKIALTMILADGSTYEHTGIATKIDRNIDPTTGALTVEADFPNPDNLLRPGMFARIRFSAAEIPDATLVPQRAVSELQSEYRMYVINPDNTIEIRQVQVGQKLGSNWIIEQGIKPGERIAVEGLLRLQPGMTVIPRPADSADLPPGDTEGL